VFKYAAHAYLLIFPVSVIVAPLCDVLKLTLFYVVVILCCLLSSSLFIIKGV
jgi:hypothetical protein